MKKKCLIALGLAACLLLGGCGGAAGETSAEGGLREIDLVLDWYPNAIHACLYNAIEEGYYAEEGLQVNIRFPTNENDAMSLVAAGQAEIGIYYPMHIIEARADQNVPLKSIGAFVQQPLNIVLSLAEENITRPADMVGKKIGYGGSELTEALIHTILENDGVSDADVEMINVGFDLMSSMTTGNVDVTVGGMINHEMPQLVEEGFDVNYFSLYDYGVPEDYEMVFVANDQTVAEDSEMLAGFLRATARGFEDMKNDPEGSLARLLEQQNEENFPLTEAVERQSMEILLPAMEKEGKPFLSQDAAVWQTDIDWLYENGLIDNQIDAADVMAEIDY